MTQNMVFNYSKLKGRITEILGSQERLATTLGCSNATLSNKLNNKVYFSMKDIVVISKILLINPEDIGSYFYTLES